MQDPATFKGRSLLSAHMDEPGLKVRWFLNLGDGRREDEVSGGVGMSCWTSASLLNAQRGEGGMGRAKAGF